jgi:MFS family permease
MAVSSAVQAGGASHARVSSIAAAAFFAICAATYVVNAADRLIFPIVVRPVAEEYGFSLAQGGTLATIYLLGLGLGGIWAGYLIDRSSRKSSMIFGIVVYSLFTILTAAAFGFFDMAAYRIMTGIGEGIPVSAPAAASGPEVKSHAPARRSPARTGFHGPRNSA